MAGQNIFADEWRDCLRAHYTYVVRLGDHGTERTLRGVMEEVGFSESEVKELYVLATAHVDDVGADFVPDVEMLAEDEAFIAVAVVAPTVDASEIDASEIDVPEMVEEVEIEAEVEPVEDENVEIEDEVDQDEPPPDPGAMQLSLF